MHRTRIDQVQEALVNAPRCCWFITVRSTTALDVRSLSVRRCPKSRVQWQFVWDLPHSSPVQNSFDFPWFLVFWFHFCREEEVVYRLRQAFRISIYILTNSRAAQTSRRFTDVWCSLQTCHFPNCSSGTHIRDMWCETCYRHFRLWCARICHHCIDSNCCIWSLKHVSWWTNLCTTGSISFASHVSV